MLLTVAATFLSVACADIHYALRSSYSIPLPPTRYPLPPPCPMMCTSTPTYTVCVDCPRPLAACPVPVRPVVCFSSCLCHCNLHTRSSHPSTACLLALASPTAPRAKHHIASRCIAEVYRVCFCVRRSRRSRCATRTRTRNGTFDSLEVPIARYAQTYLYVTRPSPGTVASLAPEPEPHPPSVAPVAISLALAYDMLVAQQPLATH